MTIDRRHFLFGTTAAGVASLASGAIHDGELGGPSQTVHGSVPWQEGTADSPPGVSGSDYIFLTKAELAFVEAAVARLIPNDPVGPGAIEANVPFFIDRQLAGDYGHGDLCVGVVAPAGAVLGARSPAQNSDSVRRTLFDSHDESGVPGKEIVTGIAELPAGTAIGWHVHSGDRG